MLLNDIGGISSATLKKINQHLESNYGFKLTETTDTEKIASIMESVKDEISELKMKGDDARSSSEITKRLLVLEGLKTLNEFAVIQFQSPELELVISNLVQEVVEYFVRRGTSMADFDDAVDNAMKHYRSSKYDFPNDYIEARVKEAALRELQDNNTVADQLPQLSGLAESVWDDINAVTSSQQHVIEKLGDLDLTISSTNVQTKESNLVKNTTTGNMQIDPFAANAAARKGHEMREHKNLVKNLRYLLETEVSQAEVMMAAKGFAQELQEMVEKIGRLQNEDLPPVTDQMRETYGGDSASAFQTQIYGALQSVMDALYTAKSQVDDAVANMASTGQVSASVDMDKDYSGNDTDLDQGDIDADSSDLDLDNIGDELENDNSESSIEDGDEFGSAEEEEPLGRAMKAESALQKKVLEMKTLVARARKLKESRSK